MYNSWLGTAVTKRIDIHCLTHIDKSYVVSISHDTYHFNQVVFFPLCRSTC